MAISVPVPSFEYVPDLTQDVDLNRKFDISQVKASQVTLGLGNSTIILMSAIILRDIGYIGDKFTAETLLKAINGMGLNEVLMVPKDYSTFNRRMHLYPTPFIELYRKRIAHIENRKPKTRHYDLARAIYESVGCRDDIWDVDITDTVVSNNFKWWHYYISHHSEAGLPFKAIVYANEFDPQNYEKFKDEKHMENIMEARMTQYEKAVEYPDFDRVTFWQKPVYVYPSSDNFQNNIAGKWPDAKYWEEGRLRSRNSLVLKEEISRATDETRWTI